MINNFCTLFDSGYLLKGLALYRSLIDQCTSDFHLYIFAFDDSCLRILKSMNLPKVTVISMLEFEDKELLNVKPTRTRAEYCWTCSSSTILYCIEKYKLENCTYLDADLYFFKAPEIILNELGKGSVLITRHNYAKKYDQSKISGKYCVQFVYFRNDLNGMKVLSWWRNSCLRWCFDRRENGKFGDQKYLDNWTSQFKGVHVLENLGGGLAPWNTINFDIKESEKKIVLFEKKMKKKYELVFFHFHGIRFFKFGTLFTFASTKNYVYELEKNAVRIIYKKYFKTILKEYKRSPQYKEVLNRNFFGFKDYVSNNLYNWGYKVKCLFKKWMI